MHGVPSRRPDPTPQVREAVQLAPRIAARVGRGSSWVELQDLAQDLFEETLKKLQENPDEIRMLKAWMYWKGRDLMKAQRRLQNRERLRSTEDLASLADEYQPSSEASVLLRRLESLLPGALGKITPKERMVVTYYQQSLSDEEIAVKMGISVLTVRVHKGNAMKKVRLHLSEAA